MGREGLNSAGRGDTELIIWPGSCSAGLHGSRGQKACTAFFPVCCSQACLDECEISTGCGFTHPSRRGDLREPLEWTLGKEMGLIIGMVFNQEWWESGQMWFPYRRRTEDTAMARARNWETPNRWVVTGTERIKCLVSLWESLVLWWPA